MRYTSTYNVSRRSVTETNSNVRHIRQGARRPLDTPLILEPRIIVMIPPKPGPSLATTQTIRLPKNFVEEIYRTSIRFAELVETLEVLLDKDAMRRIKFGERQYRRKQYVSAKGLREIRRVLST